MKTVWIVNEYNFPDDIKTRQTILCELLNDAGYDCYLISGSSNYKETANKVDGKAKYKYVETDESKGYIIKTKNFKHNYQRALVSFQTRLWHLRKKLPHPDVIVSDFAGFFGNIFLKWKKKYNTRIIYDILDLWPEGFVDMGFLKKNSILTKWLYYLEHKSYRCADGIIFSFQGGKEYITDKGWSKDDGGDVDISKIGYLNNGVDLSWLDFQKENSIYNDVDLNSNKFKIVYLGSISSFNGLDILIDIAAKLRERGFNDIDIIVYGQGNQEERLRKKASELELNNIKFKGRVEKKYAMSILTRSDLNVFTFAKTPLLKYGVSPNKLFIYFASSKPVLSLIKPKYDLVEEREAGLSVENDVDKAVDTILYFYNLPKKEYKVYCSNSRKVAEDYDYKKLVHVLIDKIEGV